MPYGKCEVHGAGWLVETCRHVAAGGRRQRPIDVYDVEGLLLCSTCLETFGLGVHEARPEHRGWTTVAATFEELGEHYSVVNETSVLCCTRCYAQLELSASRDRGLADPFHAYENTPTSWAIVERLTDALLAAFSFREFRLCSGKQTHSLEASPGSLIRPARVVVDFVEDESEQDSIVSAVGAFFRNDPETQWEVWFYRSFEVRRLPDGGCRQGHADRLRTEESHPPRLGIRRHAWYGPPSPCFEGR